MSPAMQVHYGRREPEPPQMALLAGFQIFQELIRTSSGRITLLAVAAAISLPIWLFYLSLGFG